MTPLSATSATAAATGTTAAATPAQSRDELRQAAQQFEAIFLRQILSSARSAKLADDDMFGSDATDQFRDMGDARTADAMSQKGVFGIAEMLMSQFGARDATGRAATAAATHAPAPTPGGGE